MARGNKAVGAAFNDGHTRSLVPTASRGGAYSGTMLQPCYARLRQTTIP